MEDRYRSGLTEKAAGGEGKIEVTKLVNSLSVNVWELLKLNLIFIAGCLPVVTAGASLAGLQNAVMRMLRRQSGGAVQDYKRGFRENWKPATAALVILAGFIFLLMRALLLYWVKRTTLFQVLFVLSCVVGAAVITAGLYLFPILVTMDIPLRGVCRDAFLLALLQPLKSILMLVTLAALIAVGVLFLPATLLFIVIFGGTLPAFLVGWITWSGMKKYLIRKEAEPAADVAPPDKDEAAGQ